MPLMRRVAISIRSNHRFQLHPSLLVRPVRDLCTGPAPDAFDSPIAVQGVTVVETVQQAVTAIKVLVELPVSKFVAWSSQTACARPSNGHIEHRLKSLTAFAGRDVDFGNGPHLFLPAHAARSHDHIWLLLKEYFEDSQCLKIWDHYASCGSALAGRSIQPRGLAADLHHMIRIQDNSRQVGHLDTLSESYLGKSRVPYLEKLLDQNGLSQSLNKKRPWHTDGTSAPMDASWVAYAAADAALVHDIALKLREQLERSVMHGYNSHDEYKNTVFSLDDAFSNFFGPCAKELFAIERRGLYVDRQIVEEENGDVESEREFLLSRFLSWASQHSPDALLMNLNSSSQLRQLLFAPCQNIHVKMKSMSASDTFLVADPVGANVTKEPTSSKRRNAKKRITLIGARKQAKVFTKAGWPAVSERSLRKAAGFPRAVDPTFGDPKDTEFCYAVDDLLRAKSLPKTPEPVSMSRIEYCIPSDSRVRLPHFVDYDSGKVMCEDKMSILHGKALRGAPVRAAPENVLLAAKYKQLDIQALAILSKCDILLDRLACGFDFDAMGTVLLFDHVRKAAAEGHCSVEEVQAFGEESLNNTIRTSFPSEYQVVDKMDQFVINGGNISNLAKQEGRSREKWIQLADAWYNAYEGVSHWRSACLELAKEEGFIETMMGRRRITDKMQWKTKRVRENAESAAVRFAVLGSAGEIVMSAILKLSANEALNALGWQVVCVNGNEVFLEGPAYAAKVAAPLIEDDMTFPSPFNLGIAMELDLRVVATEEIGDELSNFHHSSSE